MAASPPVRILIVDDHAMVRSGLMNFIDAYEWMEAVGEASNGAEAVEFCSTHAVDVVLMDLVMPVMDGSEATRLIVAMDKAIKVVALTSFHEKDLVEKALQAGATSYLLKNVSAEELANTIRSAQAGKGILAPEAAQALIDATRQKQSLGFDLTKREREVLTLLVKGRSNSEIAAQLSLGLTTVKFHLVNIFSKLGAKSRVEAVTIALENHLVEKG